MVVAVAWTMTIHTIALIYRRHEMCLMLLLETSS